MIKLNRKKLARVLLYGVLLVVIVSFCGAQAVIHHSPAPKVILCKGSAKEMGEHYGKELSLSTKLLIKGYLEQGVCRGNSELIERRYAVAKKVYDNLSKPYKEELQAVSDASGCDLDALMYGNSFIDLGNARAGCRSVVIKTDRSLLHAHNLDWDTLGGLAGWTTTVIRREPSDGRLKTVTVGFPGIIGSLDTINSKGIALSFNQLGYGNSVPTEPVFIMMRRIAETCDTFAEAENEILNAPEGMPFLITLSSATEGKAAIFERLGKTIEKRGLRNGWVAGCNVAQRQTVGKTFLDRAMIQVKPADSTELQGVLGHPDVLAANNLYSLIFDFENNMLYLASGKVPAAKESYRKFILFEPTPQDPKNP